MSACKGCGNPIVWGETEEGKKIPLDPRAPVYVETDPDTQTQPIPVTRSRIAMVSHFATCPDANRFSGRKKKP